MSPRRSGKGEDQPRSKALTGGLVPGLLLLAVLVCPRGTLSGEAARSGPKPYLLIPWGKGEGQAGRLIRQEGESEGPAGFAISPRGEFYLLDQVNRRILVFSPAGTPGPPIPLPDGEGEGASYGDLAVAPDGRLILLDPLIQQVLLILDPTGRELARHDLGKFVAGTRKGSQVIGRQMLFRRDGLYLEDVVSRRWFRPLDPALNLVRYDRYPGFPYRNAKELITVQARAGETGTTFRLTVGPSTDSGLRETEITLPGISQVLLLDADERDFIYLVCSYFQEDQKTGKVPTTRYRGYKWDEKLKEVDRFDFTPEDQLPLGYLNQCKLDPSGSLFLMIYTGKGVQIFRWP